MRTSTFGQTFDRAEACYDKALKLLPVGDTRMRAVCMGSLGSVLLGRFLLGLKSHGPAPVYFHDLEQARKVSEQSLRLLHNGGASDLAVIHKQLGDIYSTMRMSFIRTPFMSPDRYAEYEEKFQDHYLKAIKYQDVLGDRFRAATIRLNFAKILTWLSLRSQGGKWRRMPC